MASTALPGRAKLLYASAGLGSEALQQSRNVWLVYYYAPPEGAGRDGLLSLALVSVILFAGKLLEAFDDTLIGYWSDRTRSRLGRRIPFVLAATPFMALFALLIFTPPENAGTAATAVYLFITLELFFLSQTLMSAPYDALLPEIARTSDERVSTIALRVYLGVAGAALGLIGSGLLVEAFGFQVMALAVAALALVTRYVGLAGVWRHARRDTPATHLTLSESLRTTFSNRPFIAFLGSFVLFQTALGMLVALLPFYVSGVLERDAEGVWVALLTGIGIGAMALSIPIFGRLARRTSTHHAYGVAMLAAGLAFQLLFLAGFLPSIPKLAQIVPVMLLVGAPLAGVFLFPALIIADVCDADAARTGTRREATFYGAQAFVEKSAGSLSPLLLGLILLLGNDSANPLGIRLVGPAAGLLVLAGYLLIRSHAMPSQEPSLT